MGQVFKGSAEGMRSIWGGGSAQSMLSFFILIITCGKKATPAGYGSKLPKNRSNALRTATYLHIKIRRPISYPCWYFVQ